MSLAITLLTLLAQHGPELYSLAVNLVNNPDPKKEDFLALIPLTQKGLHDLT